jgi:hypothetical protein
MLAAPFVSALHWLAAVPGRWKAGVLMTMSVAPGAPTYYEGSRQIVMTPTTIDQLARGELQLVRRGSSIPFKLTRDQRIEFDAAKVRGFVITHNWDRTLRNLYGVYCDVIGRPCITVDPRINYAAISCELPDTAELSEAAQERIDVLWRSHAVRGAWWSVGSVFCHCSKIPRDHAETVAAMLWQEVRTCEA